ncbi:MAG: hypothetical protein V2A72_00785 [Candidatus Omnitrophota bacterium]
MKKQELLKNLRELGYPLLGKWETTNANKTLAEVVKSKDSRLHEGFPLLLVNSMEKGLFDYTAAKKYLKAKPEKSSFEGLVVMSLALYDYLGLKLSFVDQLYNMDFFNKKAFEAFLKSFKSKDDLKGTTLKLSSVRVVNVFESYFKEKKASLTEYTQMKDEFDLEYALSQLFSKKQKELFLKRLKGEKFTKTEREYFSRRVKKKVLALANTALYNLAQKIAKE